MHEQQHTVRFKSEDELRLVRVIAAYEGVSVSSWIRDAALAKMHSELPGFVGVVKEIVFEATAQNTGTMLDTSS